MRPSPTTTCLSVLVAAVLGATLFAPKESPGPTDPMTAPVGRRVVAARPGESRRPLAVTSEGLAAMDAPRWHAAGHTGAGVTVAVLDVGFASLDDVPTDDLPADVLTMTFDDDGVLDIYQQSREPCHRTPSS